MARLDGYRAAPVRTERDPRPHSEDESTQSQQQPDDCDCVILRNDAVGKKIPREPVVVNKQKPNHQWNHMFEALPGKLTALRGLAPCGHQEPDNGPDEPDFRRNLKCVGCRGHLGAGTFQLRL